MKRDAMVIAAEDNVATALRRLESGEVAAVGTGSEIVSLTVAGPVEYGHKFAIRAIGRGDDIIKYGEIIGRATEDIAEGAHVHVQNIESLRGRGDLD